MNTRWTRTALAFAIVLTLLAPLAAAHEPEEATTDKLDYYLNASDGTLYLSHLAPSAMNATTWTYVMGDDWDDTVTVRLDVPPPVYDVNETAGVAGAIRAAAECDPDVYWYCDAVRMSVELVEGERRVELGDYSLSSYDRTFHFDGEFPGHGNDEAPHTHGDGSDADRPLRTGDIAFEITFRYAGTFGSGLGLTSGDYQVSVYIDGHSFAHLDAASGPMAPEPAPSNATDSGNQTNATGPSGNETGPNGTGNGNGTAGGNATNSSSSSAGDPGEGLVFLADNTVDAPGFGLLAVVAAVGLGIRRFQKRITRDHH